LVSTDYAYQVVSSSLTDPHPTYISVKVPVSPVDAVACGVGPAFSTLYVVWFMSGTTVSGYTWGTGPLGAPFTPYATITLPSPMDSIYSREYMAVPKALAGFVAANRTHAVSYSVRDNFKTPIIVTLDDAFAKGPFESVSRISGGVMSGSNSLDARGFVALGRGSSTTTTPGQALSFTTDASNDPDHLFKPLSSNFVEGKPVGFASPTNNYNLASTHWTQGNVVFTWNAAKTRQSNITLSSVPTDNPFTGMGIVLRDVTPPLTGLLALQGDGSPGYSLTLVDLDGESILEPPTSISSTDTPPEVGVGNLQFGPISDGQPVNYALGVADSSGLLAIQLVARADNRQEIQRAKAARLAADTDVFAAATVDGGVCTPMTDPTYSYCQDCSTTTVSLCGATLPCQATLSGSSDCCYAVNGINRCCSSQPPGYDGFDGNGCH
jgi:hypothetical protein